MASIKKVIKVKQAFPKTVNCGQQHTTVMSMILQQEKKNLILGQLEDSVSARAACLQLHGDRDYKALGDKPFVT